MTANQRDALMWAGGAVALCALALALFWTDLRPSSFSPRHEVRSAASDASSAATPSPPVRTPSTLAQTPIETVEPTPSSTLNAGRPSRPEAARGLTVAAAAVFARSFFLEAVNHAKATGDTSAIRAWSDLSCTKCLRNVSAFTTSNQANGLLTGDHRWRNLQVSRADLTDPQTATVELSMSIGHHTYRPNRRTAPAALPARTVSLRLTLAAAGDDWVMFDWEGLE